MFSAIVLSFLQLLSTSDTDSTFVSESKTQAKYYMQQIEDGRNIAGNIWALTLIGSEHDEIKSFIEEQSQPRNSLQTFHDFESNFGNQLEKAVSQTGSASLLVALLLSVEDKKRKKEIYRRYLSTFSFPSTTGVNYAKLCKAIINKREITEDILSSKIFRLPHFFLLFNSNYGEFFSTEYLQSAIKKWNNNFRSEQNLISILRKVSYFRILYLEDKYSNIASLYQNLAEKNFFPNSSLKLRIYRYLDYSMYNLGYYDRSLEIMRTFAIPLATYLDKESEKINIKFYQGIYLYSIGKIQQAEKIYQEVLTEAENKDVNIPWASLYNNLALAYHKLGKYEKYLDYQFKALENAQNYSFQLEIYNNLFIYYKRNNDQENALNYLEKARQLAQETGNSGDLGKIYISLGTSYRQFDHSFDKAFTYFTKAEEVLDPNNNSENYIYLLVEQANTYEKQQQYAKALEKYDQILTLTPNENNPNHLDALVNKALVNLWMGNVQKAGSLISRFKSFDLSQLEFQQIVKAKTVEADYLHRTGQSQKALEILNPSLDQIVVRAKGSAELKSGFWHVEEEYLDAFDLAVSIYQDEGQPAQAIQKLDQLKNINDAQLYQNPLVKSSLLNESELTQYKQLTNQLDATRKKLLTASEEQQFNIRQQISKLNLKKRKLDQKLTKNIDPNTISIREVQNRLSSSEMVMHVTELNDQYYIANIYRSDVTLKTVPLDSTLRKLLSHSVRQVATNETNLNSLQSITKLLGIKDIPARIEKVTVIPDSYLYQLPIDILPLTEPTHSYSYGETTYLIEKYKTQYLTSLNDFSNPGKVSTNARNQISYVGYGVSNFSGYQDKSLVPLPFAEKEVQSIAQELTHMSDVQIFTNNSSTKKTFTSTAPKARILHMATHSSVSEQDPMFSTVYMSKSEPAADSTFDDQIFAYELFELNLNNEMIMLNSCESGSGSYIQGTGVMGISRALRYAGANSLVLNLWSVNDMLASEFAIYFYEQLNQGKSKAEALQATKQYFLRTKNASPHFWGPYMLIGNTEPVVNPDYNNNLAMAGAFIFYFLLMVGLSFLKEQGILFMNNPSKSEPEV